METFDSPHRRYNPLIGEWVLVSSQRTSRPWQGQVEGSTEEQLPAYDPECYLCPGNERAGRVRNPAYTDTFAFTNDFPAILPDSPSASNYESPLLRHQSVQGTCRVICFSPRHDLTLAEMLFESIRRVVDLWGEQVAELGQKYKWVQVFENKGAMMGSSNPHPHGQIWASNRLPNEPAREDREQRAYFVAHGRPLLIDYARLEAEKRYRVVVENEHWLIIVPYWAVWPFETLLVPRRHVLSLPDLNDAECDGLVDGLKRILIKYDNLFECSFPYSMGWHGAPMDEGDYRHWQLHAHIYPPLLRSATVRKFLVGYEILAEPQRDITAEQAADRLRSLLEIHYKETRSVGVSEK